MAMNAAMFVVRGLTPTCSRLPGSRETVPAVLLIAQFQRLDWPRDTFLCGFMSALRDVAFVAFPL